MSRPKIALADAFADLPDPRIERGKKHLLSDILLIAVCAVIAGADSFEQIERLDSAGVPLILVSLEDPNWKEAFIHPSNARGVLVQLAESPYSDDDTALHFGDLFPEAVLLEG